MADGQTARDAWQPFTVAGVARFAYASLPRLLAMGALTGLLCGTAAAALASFCWAPVIERAIQMLPEKSSIQAGALRWPDSRPVTLAENRFLTITANPDGAAMPRETSDLHVEFQLTRVELQSLAGYLPLPYPRGWTIALNKAELEPLWGAWKPVLLIAAVFGVMLALMVNWALLALFYAWVPKLIGFYSDRRISFFGAWKLSYAALMPGAILMCFGMALYALGEIPLVFFALIAALHLVVGWVYLLLPPFRLEPMRQAPRKNPFGNGRKGRAKNPFN